MITGAAFTPQINTTQYQNGGFTLVTSQTALQCFVAPVSVPQGAHLDTVRVSYQKLASGNLIRVKMRRTAFGSADFEEIANAAGDQPPITSGGFGIVAYGVAPEAAVVKHSQFGYYLDVCISAGAPFFMARIEYTYQSAGE